MQYLRYVAHAFTRNSALLRTGNAVGSDIISFLPASAELMLAALIIAAPLSLLFGLASAAGRRGAAVLRLSAIVFASRPSFALSVRSCCSSHRGFYRLPAGGQTSNFNAPTGPTGFR